MALGWRNTSEIESIKWTCGYCGAGVGGNVGYKDDEDSDRIYICPSCGKPTAFVYDEGYTVQVPSASFGAIIDHLPREVHIFYEEIKRCVQYTAYTSAVLSMRKLIMHVAVDKGAKPNLHFVKYIDFLDAENWIPKSGKEWVDKIRKTGNQATHEIVLMSKQQAMQFLKFIEFLLQIVYEFPKSEEVE